MLSAVGALCSESCSKLPALDGRLAAHFNISMQV